MNFLQCNMQVLTTWTALDYLSGQTYSPVQNISTINKLISYSTLVSNNALGGANELYSAITLLPPSGSQSVNLNNFTDILGNSQSLARVKFLMVQNLAITDDAVWGTNCTSVQAGGGSGAWNSGQLNIILNGGVAVNGSPSSGGVAVVSGLSNLLLTNLDSTNSGAVQITIIGGTT
jgi:hypothetical protein